MRSCFIQAINTLWDPTAAVHSGQRPMLPVNRAPSNLQPLSSRARTADQPAFGNVRVRRCAHLTCAFKMHLMAYSAAPME